MRTIMHGSRLLIIIWAVAIAACYSYRLAPGMSPPGSLVRVRFDTSASMNVSLADGDTLRLTGVSRVEGRVLSVRRDTLRLDVSSARADRELVPHMRGRRAAADVVIGPGRVVEVREPAASRSFVAAAGVTATALLTIVLITVASAEWGW
jgi:hypothetical protein